MLFFGGKCAVIRTGVMGYGWFFITIAIVASLVPLLRRPPTQDVLLFATSGAAIAFWNYGEMLYSRGPYSTTFGGFYLAGLAYALTTFFIMSKRLIDRSWWPTKWGMAGLAALPVIHIGLAFLPDSAWESIFWTMSPWGDEVIGWGYLVHSAYCVMLVAIGGGALIRRGDTARGTDRILAYATILAVATGLGAQLTNIRIMSITGLVALVLLVWAYMRMNPSTVALLAQVSERDSLTGALTRGGLDNVLKRAVDEARSAGTPLSVMVIDVDNFKNVNDAHGHMTGDMALKYVSTRARSIVTEIVGDTVGRFGGDEFVVVLPGIGLIEAHGLARRIVADTSEPFDAAGLELKLSVSVGVAEYDSGTSDDLLVAADRAMYSAKRRGGGFASLPRAIG